MADSTPEKDQKPSQRSASDVSGTAAGVAAVPTPDMSACMDKFARSFEASARRWELIVYPLLFAFVILAAYGFYLIYQLTNSVDQITGHMDVISERMVQIADDMHGVAGDMGQVAKNMQSMTGNLEQITVSVGHQDHSMGAMSVSLEHMTQSMSMMSTTIYQMRYDTAMMGHNIHNATGPMRFMNTFMPW
ncbi:MAG: DUF948 domain-containing protein [Gammaproteobacteria bacterium]|nr:DUF948 domain-containing protein [Gammaproteobacteria bacterium]